MSVHVRPSGENKVNIVANNQEIKNVTCYGEKAGKLAKLMGIAEEIRSDDNKLYYVNIRSLGKQWKSEEIGQSTSESKSLRKKIIKAAGERLEIRQQKKDFGKELLKQLPNQEALNAKVENIISDNKGFILTPILHDLLFDESNLTDVFDKLATEVNNIDKENTIINKDMSKIDDYQKRQILKTFSAKLYAKKELPGGNKPLTKKEQLENQYQKDLDKSKSSLIVTDFFVNLQTKHASIYAAKKEKIAKIASHLLLDLTNLSTLFTDIMKEIESITPSATTPTGLETLKNLSPEEKLAFVLLIRNRAVDQKREEEIKKISTSFIQNLAANELTEIRSLPKLRADQSNLNEITLKLKNMIINNIDLKGKKQMEDFLESLEHDENLELYYNFTKNY